MPELGRILIIDDDHDIAFGAGMRLRAAGYEIIMACDGRQGLESARENRPDTILLDVRMPRMDGLHALDELKRGTDTGAIPIIMLSASMCDERAALDHGARFFLSKPYQNDDLLTAVKTALHETGRATAEASMENAESVVRPPMHGKRLS